jgi:hypothetical protein
MPVERMTAMVAKLEREKTWALDAYEDALDRAERCEGRPEHAGLVVEAESLFERLWDAHRALYMERHDR